MTQTLIEMRGKREMYGIYIDVGIYKDIYGRERERGREGEKALLLPVPKLRCNVNTALNNKGALMITIPGNLHPQLPSSQG